MSLKVVNSIHEGQVILDCGKCGHRQFAPADGERKCPNCGAVEATPHPAPDDEPAAGDKIVEPAASKPVKPHAKKAAAA